MGLPFSSDRELDGSLTLPTNSYGYEPAPGSPEETLVKTFLKPQDWVNWPLA